MAGNSTSSHTGMNGIMLLDELLHNVMPKRALPDIAPEEARSGDVFQICVFASL
jgi:hypothetical protein